ncbi:hypothetical protein Hypma_007458 [Hypsizygus marmoreus]|uniref:Uncharacterized protein n=1 Tax=Hypsizygus marmoreus TaxID=39966 RepID=A0A369JXZ0_HYPMA|nr:hypothetical protein Hypma_007458 [Hypsizygus marmoreus]
MHFVRPSEVETSPITSKSTHYPYHHVKVFAPIARCEFKMPSQYLDIINTKRIDPYCVKRVILHGRNYRDYRYMTSTKDAELGAIRVSYLR